MLRWTSVGCSAPYNESVTARLADRGLLVESDAVGDRRGSDSTSSAASVREVVVVLCDDERRWEVLRRSADDVGVVTIAVLPVLDLDGYIRALSLGADGVVYADTSSAITADVIVAAAQGEVLLPSQAAQAMAKLAHRERPSTELDAVDLELLRALSEGTTVANIADRLHYSERTVRRYLQNVYLRLGVRNRAEAITTAARLGLLD
jgi:DNA-binding NarL/FixJ family response regulator